MFGENLGRGVVLPAPLEGPPATDVTAMPGYVTTPAWSDETYFSTASTAGWPHTDSSNIHLIIPPAYDAAVSGVAFTLQCPHPLCRSKRRFTRQCDLDKHYRSHFRRYFCRLPNCHDGATDGPPGFPTIKDRDRHEHAHNPTIPCEDCGKLFSRLDNLASHRRRLHKSDGSVC